MDEEIEKELEQHKNLSFDGKLDLGLIIPARNPKRIFTLPIGRFIKGKQLSEILISERRSARF
jgi:hypothetical protein